MKLYSSAKVDSREPRSLGFTQDSIALIDEAAIFGVFYDINGSRL
jgi:hypothetical protein